MHLFMLAMGSRGDVQPILPLARGLQEAGYQITIAAGSNFEEWIVSEGFAYHRIELDMQAMMTRDSGKEWIHSSNVIQQARNMKRMIRENGQQINLDFMKVIPDVDVIVSGLATFDVAQSLAEAFHKRHIAIYLQPMRPTGSPQATLQPIIKGHYSALNRVSGNLGGFFTWFIFGEMTNEFRTRHLHLPPMTWRDHLRLLKTVPTIFGFSPHVVPKPDDWGDNAFVTGFWFQESAPDWQPPADLLAFLKDGAAPVYIGFGSMASKDPQETLAILLDAVQQSGQRSIISAGWAALQARDLPDPVFLLDYAPHDWLFQQVAAVVHHGGAGTTAAGLRAGIPATIVAHTADQPYWGQRLVDLGVSPALIQRTDLRADTLAQAIRRMVDDRAMQQRAQALAQAIQSEDGIAQAVQAFDHLLRSGAQAE